MKKHYLSLSLLCICCTFIFSICNTYAASIGVPTLYTGSNLRAVLMSSQISDIEDINGNIIEYGIRSASYKLEVPCYWNPSSDGYLNGAVGYSFNITFGGMANFSTNSISFYSLNNEYQGIYSSCYRNGASALSGSGRIVIVCDNVFVHDATFSPITLCIEINGIVTSGYDIPSYMAVSNISINSTSGNLSLSPNPESLGFAGVIKQSIINALTEDIINGESVYDLIQLFVQYEYNTNQSLYRLEGDLADILDETIAILGMQSATVNKIQEVYNVLYNSIYSEILTYFPNYSQRLGWIIDRLDTLIHMNESDTDYESDIDDAGVKASSFAEALNVDQPSIGNIIDGQQESWADYAADGGVPYFWANNGRIAAILAMSMVTALIGFVLYGKSG